MARLGLIGLLVWAACSRGDGRDAQAFQGIVELDEVTLAFEVGGRVARVAVEEGDRVAGEGQLLAALDDSLAIQELLAQRAQLRAQQAQLALLEAGARAQDVRAARAELSSVQQQQQVLARERARLLQLNRAGAVPESRLDSLDAQDVNLSGRAQVLTQKLQVLQQGARPEELAAAAAGVDALAAQVKALELRLARYALYASGALDVIDVLVKPDEVVSPGAPAVTVADLDHPYVDVFVPQAEIADVSVGQAAQVRVDALTQALAGRVESIARHTEFTPRFLFTEDERAHLVIRARVRIADPEHRLRAGVPAFVTFAPSRAGVAHGVRAVGRRSAGELGAEGGRSRDLF